MCFNSEISLGDVVQTIVGFVAILLSIWFYFKSNKQYKQNQENSDKQFKENQNQLKKVSTVLKDQGEIAERQLNEIRELNKPRLHLKIFDISSSTENGKVTGLRLNINFKNLGYRNAIDVRFSGRFVNDVFERAYALNDSNLLLTEVLNSGNSFDKPFDYKMVGDEKYLFCRIVWKDVVIDATEVNDYYYEVHYNIYSKPVISPVRYEIEREIQEFLKIE